MTRGAGEQGSILSFPECGTWGRADYRGNCSGHVYRRIFEALRPAVFTEPMVGGGTSVEVAREMGIEAYGLDLHSGFNILARRILDAVGKPSKFHNPIMDWTEYSLFLGETQSARDSDGTMIKPLRCVSIESAGHGG